MTPERVYMIGPWRFSDEDGMLSRPGEARRLEDRAARTLALLCRRRGEVVSQPDILTEVWNGRAVSANSVAIVIGDLRRALGDDARRPTHIETLSKRGYRLRAETASAANVLPAPPRRMRPGRRTVVAGGALAVAAGVLALWRVREPATLRIVALPVQNDTGRPEFDRLARALGLLVDLKLAGLPHVALSKADAARGDALRFRSRLIMWNGEPTLSLEAAEPTSGKVLWAGMAEGPPSALAGNTISQVGLFAQRLKVRS